MKKFCRVFLSLLIVASMLIATAVAASAKTADPVGPTPDPGDGHTHTWTVSFTWNINAPKRIYKATATFTCTGCGLTSTRTANVTVAGTTCTATVVGPDGKTYTDTVHLDNWQYQKFEWNFDNGAKAFVVYKCKNCGEIKRVEATVTRIARGYKASITATQALDGVARTATYITSVSPVLPREDKFIGEIGALVPAKP